MLSCSAQLAQIYGMTVPEVLDFFISTEAETGLIHPGDKARYRKIINDSNALSKGFNVEYRIITLSGDTRHLYEHSEVVLDSDCSSSVKAVYFLWNIGDAQKMGAGSGSMPLLK
jgi:hypothetical protein